MADICLGMTRVLVREAERWHNNFRMVASASPRSFGAPRSPRGASQRPLGCTRGSGEIPTDPLMTPESFRSAPHGFERTPEFLGKLPQGLWGHKTIDREKRESGFGGKRSADILFLHGFPGRCKILSRIGGLGVGRLFGGIDLSGTH